jgi:uncharacterized membrane protein HdeD (DUF308 family)
LLNSKELRSVMFVILAHNWWMLLLRGALALVFGLLCAAYPGVTLIVMKIMFGAYALLDGILALASSISAAGVRPRWRSTILEGAAGIFLGLLILVWAGITAFGLLYLIGVWAIITGIFEITAALRLRQHFTNEWLLIMCGAASVIFGLLILVIPSAGVLAVVWWVGAYSIFFGMAFVALAFRLRRWVARGSELRGAQ